MATVNTKSKEKPQDLPRGLVGLLVFLCLFAPCWGHLLADSWSQFRGPSGTGLSRATDLPTTWDESTNIVWKTAIHDKGWSSPVVLGKQIWVTTAKENGTAQWAVCVDRDSGKMVHDVKVFETPKPPYTFIKDYNSHASPSPVIEEGRVYVHFGSAGTACLNTETGKIVWTRRDHVCDHWRAPGSSPILWKDLLILTFDGYDRQYLSALDKKTGKTIWEKERTIDYKTDNGDLKKAYATPSILDVAGKPQLVSPGAVGTVAYDPATGKELWKVHHGGMNAASPPVMGHGKVFLTIGYGSKLVAIRPTGSGDVTNSHVDWTYGKGVPTRPAPLLLGDLLFIVSDTGIASGIDPKTSKMVWTRRINGTYSSSPVYADGKLYVFDHDGNGHVLTADREGKLLSTNRLDAGVRATPAIVGKALFVRTYTHLYRIEKK
jgi:outer membrane protein assembly factor BamB